MQLSWTGSIPGEQQQVSDLLGLVSSSVSEEWPQLKMSPVHSPLQILPPAMCFFVLWVGIVEGRVVKLWLVLCWPLQTLPGQADI